MGMTMIKKILWLAFYLLPVLAYAANFNGTRADHASPSPARNAPRPLRVTIFKSHGSQPARLSLVSANSPLLKSGRPTTQEVRAYVRTQAEEHGVDPMLALWIVKHESSFNPRAMGDGEASRGLWQISRIYHPEVSDTAAFDVASSTDWSLKRISSGKASEWSTYRNCRTLYEDCPF
jgi:transglycosylase-like protein with SLT domain